MASAPGSSEVADTGPQGDAAFQALMEKITRERAFECRSYKQKCLRRRIAVRMRARGVHGFDAYSRLLDTDPNEFDRLLDALTINVTKFLRNPEAYEAMARLVVPVLWAGVDGPINVWSAGCASGEEPYSLAILFHRHAERVGQLDRISRVRILGTDIDRESLAAAGDGVYEAAAFSDTSAEILRRYFGPGPPHAVIPELRPLVHFEKRDLLRDRAPAGPFHLIVCRNVIIYFDRETQESLFARFREAMHDDAFLVLGKVETLLGRSRLLFAPVEARERIFRRQ